ncbi:MAG: M24 family metallopeptidase [Chloroflexi bacterium]|nr:M24 family metallopeptidase [Chloroflexota bacterium]
MVGSMLEAGGEVPTMIMWTVGPPGWAQRGPMPTQRPMQTGDAISAEVEGRWAGYVGQVTTTAHLGPLPQEFRDMEALQQEALRRCMDAFRPGETVGHLVEIAHEAAKGSDFACNLITHGRGLGDDAPLYAISSRDQRVLDWQLRENAVMILKPLVMTEGRRSSVCLGDSMVCTPAGARRLGTRALKVLELV